MKLLLHLKTVEGTGLFRNSLHICSSSGILKYGSINAVESSTPLHCDNKIPSYFSRIPPGKQCQWHRALKDIYILV